jgi:uncharacterized membrane protein YgaE (UPF0421/DUF939 family)
VVQKSKTNIFGPQKSNFHLFSLENTLQNHHKKLNNHIKNLQTPSNILKNPNQTKQKKKLSKPISTFIDIIKGENHFH